LKVNTERRGVLNRRAIDSGVNGRLWTCRKEKPGERPKATNAAPPGDKGKVFSRGEGGGTLVGEDTREEKGQR